MLKIERHIELTCLLAFLVICSPSAAADDPYRPHAIQIFEEEKETPEILLEIVSEVPVCYADIEIYVTSGDPSVTADDRMIFPKLCDPESAKNNTNRIIFTPGPTLKDAAVIRGKVRPWWLINEDFSGIVLARFPYDKHKRNIYRLYLYPRVDQDQDGYSPEVRRIDLWDCNDQTNRVSPNKPEIVGDGIDSNCNRDDDQ